MAKQESINRFYAGIGSRETPENLRVKINHLSIVLEKNGFVLRSGGADGADTFFEERVEKKEIYLPWKGFNKNPSQLYNVTDEAFTFAEKFHPAWKYVKYGGRKCLARNAYQVLGKDLNDPVDFIVCWTKGGGKVGGTAQAMRIAEEYNIPVFNLFDGFEHLKSFLDENYNIIIDT